MKHPKPDGWHTYHICDGQLREIVRVTSTSSRFSQLTCSYCGEWCEVLVKTEKSLHTEAVKTR